MQTEVEVRRSDRAKRLQIKITNYGKIVVVVPKRVRRFDLDSVLNNHRNWINDRLSNVASKRKVSQEEDKTLPDYISLRLTDQKLQMAYEYRPGRSKIVEQAGSIQILSETQQDAHQSLVQWLQAAARESLTSLLQEMSKQTDLCFNKLTIRGQKTRWGSCSARKNINLNRNLLFLPEYLVRYLMIHELCHTRYLNHSADYWKFVESFEPDFKKYEKQLSHAYVYVPKWAVS